MSRGLPRVAPGRCALALVALLAVAGNADARARSVLQRPSLLARIGVSYCAGSRPVDGPRAGVSIGIASPQRGWSLAGDAGLVATLPHGAEVMGAPYPAWAAGVAGGASLTSPGLVPGRWWIALGPQVRDAGLWVRVHLRTGTAATEPSFEAGAGLVLRASPLAAPLRLRLDALVWMAPGDPRLSLGLSLEVSL